MELRFEPQTSFDNGLHLACVMDGNGRWAEARGLPRAAGHRAGVGAVRRVVEAAPRAGVSVLTLYAFSQDNWRRPEAEVSALMALFGRALGAETARLKRAGVRLVAIGRRDRLPLALRDRLARAEWETRRGTRLLLRLAVDYSARDAIRRAAALAAGCGAAAPSADAFEAALARADDYWALALSAGSDPDAAAAAFARDHATDDEAALRDEARRMIDRFRELFPEHAGA